VLQNPEQMPDPSCKIRVENDLPVLAVLAAPVAIVAVVTIVYSYVEFRKNSD